MSKSPKLSWECPKCGSGIVYPRDAYCGYCLTVINWESAFETTRAQLLECAKQEGSPIYTGDVKTDNFIRLSSVLDIISKQLNLNIK